MISRSVSSGVAGEEATPVGAAVAVSAALWPCSRLRPAAPAERFDLARLAEFATGAPADLAARGHRQPAGGEQDDVAKRQLMAVEDGLPYRGDQLYRIERKARLPGNFDQRDRTAMTGILDSDDGGAPGRQRRMGRGRRGLDILGMMIDAVEDDEIVAPAGDEEPSLVIEAEIPGPHIAARCACDRAIEDGGCLRLAAPIAGRDTRARHADLADAPVRQDCLPIRIGDSHGGL
jgi:hypothetical protein